MPYYSPQEPKTQVNIRMPRGLRTALEELADFWTQVDRAKATEEKLEEKDWPSPWNVTDVVIRLLSVGIDGAWGEVDGRPANGTQLAELAKRFGKKAAQR